MISGAIGAVIGVIAVLLISAGMRNKINARGGCPECGTPVPATRRPTSFKQAMWGGWTCKKCGTELNRRGEVLLQPNA